MILIFINFIPLFASQTKIDSLLLEFQFADNQKKLEIYKDLIDLAIYEQPEKYEEWLHDAIKFSTEIKDDESLIFLVTLSEIFCRKKGILKKHSNNFQMLIN